MRVTRVAAAVAAVVLVVGACGGNTGSDDKVIKIGLSFPLSGSGLASAGPARDGALLAIKAEGHYLQVYTDAGSDLILYRLSDALLELGGEDGAQAHRSWWVASRALAPQRHRDRLVLTNGVDVPVSRSFRVAARQRGWLTPAETRE